MLHALGFLKRAMRVCGCGEAAGPRGFVMSRRAPYTSWWCDLARTAKCSPRRLDDILPCGRLLQVWLQGRLRHSAWFQSSTLRASVSPRNGDQPEYLTLGHITIPNSGRSRRTVANRGDITRHFLSIRNKISLNKI